MSEGIFGDCFGTLVLSGPSLDFIASNASEMWDLEAKFVLFWDPTVKRVYRKYLGANYCRSWKERI